ncbi:MAG: hypothetical protein EON59_10095, partial [Alphaproteobacteria bacterium]
MKNVTERHGHLYFRRKIAGKDSYIRLPALDHPDFAAEYQRLSTTPDRPAAPTQGSIAALAVAYKGSLEWQGKDIKTRINQGRYLDAIVKAHGHRQAKDVKPVNVWRMRDDLADTPGAAAIYLSVFKTLMKYAMRLGWRDTNPAAEVPMLAVGEHEPWPADLLTVCLAEATPMTRLAIVTGLCSGQRIGDCIRMQYGWIAGGIMQFTQQKRRKGGVTKDVALPMHPLWIEELAKLPRKSVTLLYGRSGAPFKDPDPLQERLRALMAQEPVKQVIADLVARETVKEGDTFTFHGLRKNACCYLLETGLNDSEVGSLLGMSPDMVRHYGKRSRALMIALGAVGRVTGGTVALRGTQLQVAGVAAVYE